MTQFYRLYRRVYRDAIRKTALVVGLISIPLGGLWMLQGLGIMHVRPILCFVDCEPIQGASLAWAIAGLLIVTAGIFAVFFSFQGRARR